MQLKRALVNWMVDLRDSPRRLHRVVKRWKYKRVLESYSNQNEKNIHAPKGAPGEESRDNVKRIR